MLGSHYAQGCGISMVDARGRSPVCAPSRFHDRARAPHPPARPPPLCSTHPTNLTMCLMPAGPDVGAVAARLLLDSAAHSSTVVDITGPVCRLASIALCLLHP